MNSNVELSSPHVGIEMQSTSRHQEPRLILESSHFDMARFVLCWTGLATKASIITGKL